MNPQQAQAQAQVQQVQAQAQAQAAQAQAQAQAARMAIIRPTPGGQGTLKLMNFVDQLGRFHSSRGEINQISYWQPFVEKHFTETGSFIHVIWSQTAERERTKMFEIVYAALPRYFFTQFSTDVDNLQITLDGATEKSTNAETKVTCDRAKFIYTYSNRCQVRKFSLFCLNQANRNRLSVKES